MTWTDTIFHSDIFLTFGPRLALHQEGEMSVSSQSRHKQTICGFRRWSPCTTSLRCMSPLVAQSRHPLVHRPCPLSGAKRTPRLANSRHGMTSQPTQMQPAKLTAQKAEKTNPTISIMDLPP